MHSNLSCQLKIDCFRYELFYISLIETTMQKLIADTENKSKKATRELQNREKQWTKWQLIFTLNVNWLNSPIVRHRVGEWIIKQRPIYILSKRDLFQMKRHRDWKWRDGKKNFHVNGNQKKVAVTILIWDKIAIKTKCMRKKSHYIIIGQSNKRI